MDQPDVDNQTDFAVHPQVLCDRDGERLVAIVKATFEITESRKPKGNDGSFEIAPKDRRRGIRSADVPWGKPHIPSILYPADLCLRKPATDVIVTGVAYAQGGIPVPAFDAGVRIGAISKSVRVTGPRVWLDGGGGTSAPKPIDALELRYDFAWGGLDDSDPTRVVEESRNPIGRGKVRDPSTLGGQAAPQIEDPRTPIGSATGDYVPAGLSAVGRSFAPRRTFFGTYDRTWLDDRAPLLPKDFDDRSNLVASPGLVMSPPLRGGEEGAFINLTPGGDKLAFVLPRVPIEVVFLVEGRPPETFQPAIDTLLLDTLPRDDGLPLTIEMVMRASVVAPRKMKGTTIIVREKKR